MNTIQNAYDSSKSFFRWLATITLILFTVIFFLQVDYLQTKKDRDLSTLTASQKQKIAELDAQLYAKENELTVAENNLDYSGVSTTRRQVTELYIQKSNIVETAPHVTIYHKIGVLNDN